MRHFLPQLRTMPSKYIYEPWTAPLEVQRKCGCILGKDYPYPVVDHYVVMKDNMDKMKAAYEASRCVVVVCVCVVCVCGGGGSECAGW